MTRMLLCLLALASALFAAEPADLAITGRYVVTMNARHAIIENGAVVIKDGKIAAVGQLGQILKDWLPGRRIDRPELHRHAGPGKCPRPRGHEPAPRRRRRR